MFQVFLREAVNGQITGLGQSTGWMDDLGENHSSLERASCQPFDGRLEEKEVWFDSGLNGYSLRSPLWNVCEILKALVVGVSLISALSKGTSQTAMSSVAL